MPAGDQSEVLNSSVHHCDRRHLRKLVGKAIEDEIVVCIPEPGGHRTGNGPETLGVEVLGGEMSRDLGHFYCGAYENRLCGS